MTDRREPAAADDDPLEDVIPEEVEPDDATPEDVPLEEGQLAYDCAAWAGETRSLLKSLLVSQEVPHAWQGTTLTVRDEHEALVDELIDEVAGSALPALDPDVAKVVYAVGEWPAGLQTRLTAELAVADIAYEWDERGDLVVAESDEEQVELVLAELPDPDESEISSDDGVAVHELLDRVFLSADRLARNGDDASGTVELVDAASVLGRLALPFGFEPAQWRFLVAAVLELSDAIDGGDGDGRATDAAAGDADAELSDEQIAERAGRVRDLVRQYI